MVEKPSDIHKKNTKKLTRRRVMKLASAAGFTGTTAAALTPEDVKASDSDQVTIAFDTEGEVKKQVPADWYDHLQRTRRVRDRMEEQFKDTAGIASIGMSAGKSQDNPHVIVGLDENSDRKEERRGEIPERRNDVRVETVQRDLSKDTEDCDDEYPTEYIYPKETMPGSVQVQVNSYPYPKSLPGCTLGPRFINDSHQDFDFGWSVAAHCTDDCAIGEPVWVAGTSTQIGTVVFVDNFRDFALVERRDGYDPLSSLVFPANHDRKKHINGTVSEDGVATVENEGLTCLIWGTGSTTCEVDGPIFEYNHRRERDYSCSDFKSDQVLFDKGDDPGDQGGDSGGLWHVREPGTRDWFAVGSHTTSTDVTAVAAQGFSIRDVHNMWWDDL